MSVKVHFECPGCKHMGRVPVSYLGGIGICRYCECKFQVPTHLRLSCPHCLEVVRVRPQFLDQDVTCKLCRQSFRATLDRTLVLSQLVLVEPPAEASSAEELDITPVSHPPAPPPSAESEAPVAVPEPSLAPLPDSEIVLKPVEEAPEPPPAPLPDSETALKPIEDEPADLPADDILSPEPEPERADDEPDESEASRLVSELRERDRQVSESLQEIEALKDRLESETRVAETARRETDELRLRLEEASGRHQDEIEALRNRLQEQIEEHQHDRQAVEAGLGERISAVEAERDRLLSDQSLWQGDREQTDALRLEFEAERTALHHESEALKHERDHLRQERDEALRQLDDRAAEQARATDEHTLSETALRDERDQARRELEDVLGRFDRERLALQNESRALQDERDQAQESREGLVAELARLTREREEAETALRDERDRACRERDDALRQLDDCGLSGSALREERDALRLDLQRSSELATQHEQRIQELISGQASFEAMQNERDQAHRERDGALRQLDARADELARAGDDRSLSESALRAEIEGLRLDLQRVSGQAAERERLILDLTAQHTTGSDRLQALESEIERLSTERDRERGDLRHQVDALRDERDAARSEAEAAQAVPPGHDLAPDAREAERLAQVEAEMTTTRDALSHARRELDSLSRERVQLRTERDQATRERADLEDHYLDERFTLIQELELARDVARDRRQRIEALVQQTRRLTSELARAQESLNRRPPQAPSEPVAALPPAPSESPGLVIQTATTETAAPTDYLDLILDQWEAPASEPSRKTHPAPSPESADRVRARVSQD